MRLILVAQRLALSADPRQRWRQISVIFSVFVATFAVLVGVGVALSGAATDRQIQGRSLVLPASADEEPALMISRRGLILPGVSQIPVVWLQPTSEQDADPAVVPPGLTHLPSPGEAVLSPGLISEGYSAEDLGLKASTAGAGEGGAIGDDGLVSRSEGLVYARAAAGRDLGSGGAVLGYRGYADPAIDAGFRDRVETIPDVPGLRQGVVGAAWLLWVPAAYLLIGGGRAVSPVRDERALVLWGLGVGTRVIRRLVALETIVLATVGAVPALLVWQLWGRHRSSVPFTDAELLPGALSTSWGAAVMTTLGVTALTGAAAAVGRIRERSQRSDSRRVRGHHLVPLSMALMAMILSPLVVGDRGLLLLFGGLLGTLVTLPLAIPALVKSVAGGLRRVGSPAAWLAGQRLSLRTNNLSRPAAMVGALVFVAGSAFALLNGLQAGPGEEVSDAHSSVWSVSWRAPAPGDLTRVERRASDPIKIAPIVESEAPDSEAGSDGLDGAGALPETGRMYFDSCAEVVDFFNLTEQCTSPGAVPDTMAAARSGIIPTIGAVKATEPVHEVAVSAPAGTSEATVMDLFSGLPAPNLDQLQGPRVFEHPGTDWLESGWIIASLLLLVGLLREVGDRSILSMRDNAQLMRVGLTRAETERCFAYAVMTPLAVSIPLGFVCAVVFALRGFSLGLTVFNLSLILVVAVVAATLSVSMIFGLLVLQRRSAW